LRNSRPSPRVPGLALLGLAIVSLAGCATSGPPEEKRDPHKDATLFISPAGKPFRADPGQPYPVRVWFAEADANHDGKLTKAEFRADFQAFFQQLDTNHDGILDGEEIARYEEVVAPEILPRLAQIHSNEVHLDEPGETPSRRRTRSEPRRLAQAPMRKGQGSFDGAPEFSLLNVSEPVLGADLNFDGKVSLEEYLAAADRRFVQLDADMLGYLTLAGLPRTPEQIAVEGQKPKTR
jgi:hypothetical protein